MILKEIIVSISLNDYDIIEGISMQDQTNKMEEIILNIGNVTTANLVATIEHTKIESMIISWETYEYTGNVVIQIDFDPNTNMGNYWSFYRINYGMYTNIYCMLLLHLYIIFECIKYYKKKYKIV